jgi:hypothetical protein
MAKASLSSVALGITFDLSRTLHVRLSGKNKYLHGALSRTCKKTRNSDKEHKKNAKGMLHDESFTVTHEESFQGNTQCASYLIG